MSYVASLPLGASNNDLRDWLDEGGRRLPKGKTGVDGLARKMAYCLREGSVIELIGKRGRANLYRVPRA